MIVIIWNSLSDFRRKKNRICSSIIGSMSQFCSKILCYDYPAPSPSESLYSGCIVPIQILHPLLFFIHFHDQYLLMNVVVQLMMLLCISRTGSPVSPQKKGIEISPFEVGSMVAGNIYNSHLSWKGLPESLIDLKVARQKFEALALTRNPNNLVEAARLVIVDIVPALNRLMPRNEILIPARYGNLGKSGRKKLRESILSVIASIKALAATPPDKIPAAYSNIDSHIKIVITTISKALIK